MPYALNNDDRICRNNRRSVFRFFAGHVYGTCLTSLGGKEENAMQMLTRAGISTIPSPRYAPPHTNLSVTQRAHRLSSRRARPWRLTIISAFSSGPIENADMIVSRQGQAFQQTSQTLAA